MHTALQTHGLFASLPIVRSPGLPCTPTVTGKRHSKPHRSAGVMCTASSAAGGTKKAVAGLKSAMQGQVDSGYLAGATFLKSIGFINSAEIARVLDVAMNPNSLFVEFNDRKRSRNANARPLDADTDMAPVVDFLRSSGLSTPQIITVISTHPPVLCYSVEGRLRPFFKYMHGIGVSDVAAAVAQRPSLLGLDVDANLKKIVDYLQSVDTPPEQIVQWLVTSI